MRMPKNPNTRFLLECFLIFILATLADVVVGVHIIWLVDKKLVLAMVSVVAAHYLLFVGHVLFIQYPKWWQRLAICTSESLAAALGTAIAILWVGEL